MLMLVTRRPWFYVLLVLVAIYIIKAWIGEEFRLSKLMRSHKQAFGKKNHRVLYTTLLVKLIDIDKGRNRPWWLSGLRRCVISLN